MQVSNISAQALHRNDFTTLSRLWLCSWIPLWELNPPYSRISLWELNPSIQLNPSLRAESLCESWILLYSWISLWELAPYLLPLSNLSQTSLFTECTNFTNIYIADSSCTSYIMCVCKTHRVYCIWNLLSSSVKFPPKTDLKPILLRILFNRLLCSWTLQTSAAQVTQAIYSCTSAVCNSCI